MKANQISAEELLRGIPREQWALGWEAIMNATEKDIDFASQGRIYAYIRTYIYRKEFQETYYLRRIKNKETGIVDRTYIMRSLPVTHAMAVYGISEFGQNDESNYQEMIDGACKNGSTSEGCYDFAEIELRSDLSRLGIPDYFIDRVLDGDRLIASTLTPAEIVYLTLCREAFASLRSKA